MSDGMKDVENLCEAVGEAGADRPVLSCTFYFGPHGAHLVLRELQRADLSFNREPRVILTLNSSIPRLKFMPVQQSVTLQGKAYL